MDVRKLLEKSKGADGFLKDMVGRIATTTDGGNCEVLCRLRWRDDGHRKALDDALRKGHGLSLLERTDDSGGQIVTTGTELFACIVVDDVASLLYCKTSFRVNALVATADDVHILPCLHVGDTPRVVAERFSSYWCLRYLDWLEGSTRSTVDPSAVAPALVSVLQRRATIGRRGSLAVLKKDFSQRKGAEKLQLMIHLPSATVVTRIVSCEMMVRHVVYEVAEEHQLDLEAFSLQRDGKWLNDYKSLKLNGIRSGDELFVVLKHKALHQQKNFNLRIVIVFASGIQREFCCSVDPFTSIGVLQRFVTCRIKGAEPTMELLIPIICANASSLGGVFLDGEKTFSSYGLAEASSWADAFGNVLEKPLLMGSRDVLRTRFSIVGLQELDSRLSLWLEIIANYAEYQARKKTEMQAALILGVPDCLRGRVWELLLFNKPYKDVIEPKADATRFAELVDTDPPSETHERILDQIGNDIDRTMPYHPSFRDKGGYGQTNLSRVLRAYAMHDPELGYCQGERFSLSFFFAAISMLTLLTHPGMNFIVATLLGPLSPEASFTALTLLMTRFRLRDNFTSGMTGLHSMLEAFDRIFVAEMPSFCHWMAENSLITASFASEWFLTLFSAHSAEAALRIWDVFLWRGPKFLFQVALSILSLKETEMRENPEEAMEILKSATTHVNLTDLMTKAVSWKLRTT